MSTSIVTLNIGQDGRITIPAGFRKEHSLRSGEQLVALSLGETLVIAPHERALESILTRMQRAVKASGTTADELNRLALSERAAIVQARYGDDRPGARSKAKPPGKAFRSRTKKRR